LLRKQQKTLRGYFLPHHVELRALRWMEATRLIFISCQHNLKSCALILRRQRMSMHLFLMHFAVLVACSFQYIKTRPVQAGFFFLLNIVKPRQVKDFWPEMQPGPAEYQW